MFILITYDVNITSPGGPKRLRGVARACLDYDKRVQNSVFECVLTESQLTILKARIDKIIDKDNDSIRIYHFGKNWQQKIETLGCNHGIDFTGELII